MAKGDRVGRSKAAVLAGGGVFLLVAVLLALSAPAALAAPEGWVITQLTSKGYYNNPYPQVSGDRIVWNGGVNGSDWEIFTWTPSGGIQQLTSNGYDDSSPEVSGDRIVWYQYDGSDREIFTWTPSGGIQQLTSNGYDDWDPRVSGDRIVWAGEVDVLEYEIFTWTPTGGNQQLTSNDYGAPGPEVSGDRIVWSGRVDGSDSEIFTWTPTGGIQQLTSNGYRDSSPEVSGGRIVWDGNIDGSHSEIFTWTPTGGNQQLTSDGYDYYPQVSGDRIVWEGYDGSAFEIFTWTPSGGTQQLTSNGYGIGGAEVSGDRIVWDQYQVDGSEGEIFTWTPIGGTQQLTSNGYDEYYPEVSGDRIVWHGEVDPPDDEIFTARPALTPYLSLRGSDRFDTAIKISQAMFPAALYPDGLPDDSGVVLAPGWESYQEALCGAPLAAAWGGPVLLSSKTLLYSAVKDELVRLQPDRVFLIGLTGTSVADAVQAALPAATVTAINGTSVYHMSYLVAKKLEERVEGEGGDMASSTGIVTIGSNFPDAIGVSPLACFKKWPVLLTDYPDNRPMNAYALQAMNELGITSYVKAGTYAPDPSGILGLANFSGDDRYVTNQKVATWAYASAGLSFAHTALTTGDKFPDALAGGPYLAQDHGTLLLSPLPGPLPVPIATLLTTHAAEVGHFTFIAMVEPVISEVEALLP